MGSLIPQKYREFLAKCPTTFGVYQFLDKQQRVLYVGKAKNLKSRITSYFRAQDKNISSKTNLLVAKIADIKITITNNEVEALLLECNLIKHFKPKFNILLRDDKSYPYLYLSAGDFPKIILYRGARDKRGEYFGPYVNATAAKQALYYLQRTFFIRQCSDHFFKTRKRPCILHQIERCSAPCVAKITKEQYQSDIKCAKLFLQGKNSQVIKVLVEKMDAASVARNYEQAARLRDQIRFLQKTQQQQHVMVKDLDVDVMFGLSLYDVTAIQVLRFRKGNLLDNKSYFYEQDINLENLFDNFVSYYYLSHKVDGADLPKILLSNIKLINQKIIIDALFTKYQKKVAIKINPAGKLGKIQELAKSNAELALRYHITNTKRYHMQFAQLQELLNLSDIPTKIECFDISHTSGEGTVASCVVFDVSGALNNNYRRYNISGITGGDDYAALDQAVTRRYKKISDKEDLPSILLIDGGVGQLNRVYAVLEKLRLVNDIFLLSIAKGEQRKIGHEKLYVGGTSERLLIPNTSKVFHLIQHIRDEAHRFAIQAHRKRRAKASLHSQLLDIPGIGDKKRKSLLDYFGGMQEIKQKSIEELVKAPGINKKLAKSIYEYFHE